MATSKKKILTVDRANELFRLEDGVLFNKVLRGGLKVGDEVGSLNSWGYRNLQADGRDYKAHQVVWLITHGYLPVEIDHINGNRSDNRIENLREVDRQENLKNQKVRSTSQSGVMGVGKHCGKWRARVRVNGASVHLGYFERIEQAIEARKAADAKYGFHPNHGRQAA